MGSNCPKMNAERNSELVPPLPEFPADQGTFLIQSHKKRFLATEPLLPPYFKHTSIPILDSNISSYLWIWGRPHPRTKCTTCSVFPTISGMQALRCGRPRNWHNSRYTFHSHVPSLFQIAQTTVWPLPGPCHHKGTELKGSAKSSSRRPSSPGGNRHLDWNSHGRWLPVFLSSSGIWNANNFSRGRFYRNDWDGVYLCLGVFMGVVNTVGIL